MSASDRARGDCGRRGERLEYGQAAARRRTSVTLVSGDPLRQTTSHLAAAVWFPTASGPADAVARWSASTYDVLAREAADGVPGVYLRESLALYRDEADVRPPLPTWAEAVGDVRLARPDELPPGYPHGLRFVVPLVEMPTYLPYLYDSVLRTGAQHVQRRLGRCIRYSS